MSYNYEKSSGDIIINGWEKGISPSPHNGIANMQAVNISTENKEVMCSFARVAQQQTSFTGTFTVTGGTTVSSSHTGLLAGSWITMTSTGITGLTNGTSYYVLDNTAGLIKFSAAYSEISTDAINISGTSATFSTASYLMGQPIATCTENYTALSPYFNEPASKQGRYYILDSNGRVWVNDSFAHSVYGVPLPLWYLPNKTAQNGASGIAVLNGWLFVISDNIYSKSTVRLADPFVFFQSTLTYTSSYSNPINHFCFVGHQGKLYYTDGCNIGMIFPNTSLETTVLPNIQSFCEFTYTGVSPGATGTIFNVISGMVPNGLSTADGSYFTTTAAIDAGHTSATLSTAWTKVTGSYLVQFSDGEQILVTLTNGATTMTWSGGLASDSTKYFFVSNSLSAINITRIPAYFFAEVGGTPGGTTVGTIYYIEYTGNGTFSVYDTPTGGNPLNINGTGRVFFNTFSPQVLVGDTFQTVTFSQQVLILPTFETATTIAEIGNNLLIGCYGNVVYPWNQIDPLPSDFIFLPENGVSSIITVNNMGYIFAGNKGNIYITNGSTAAAVISVPDYCAGTPGTPRTYLEPYFIWGGTMYLKGRVYFSIQDQNAGKTTGNCGGIWSFIPTQNIFFGQDVGLALRQENRASYGTYNGMSTVLIPSQNQLAVSPQYWNGWQSTYTGTSYGIDFTGTYNDSTPAPAIIETDLIPVGTMLDKKTFKQIEYKLASPLEIDDKVAISYRVNGTDSWISCGTAIVESLTGLSGYFSVNFEKSQWLQFKITLNGVGAESYVRLSEIRIR